MKLIIIDRKCPHRPGSNRERMWNLVVSMDGCTREDIGSAITALCRTHGWSNTHAFRPADRMVETGHARWER